MKGVTSYLNSLKSKLSGVLEIIGIKPTEEEEGSLTLSEFFRMFDRVNVSRFLVPEFYDRELECYINADNSIGFLFEAIPVFVLGEQSIQALVGYLKGNVPQNSVLQVICYADPDVDDILDAFIQSKIRASEQDFLERSYKSLVEYYRKGVFGFPVRTFRVLIALKIPFASIDLNNRDAIREQKKAIEESFRAARIPVFNCPPEGLLSFLRRLLNDDYGDFNKVCLYEYTDAIPLNKQIVKAETEIIREGRYIKVGNKYFVCQSPKSFPQRLNYFFANSITGVYEGPTGDHMQIESPFFITMTVVFDFDKTSFYTKANMILQQQALGTFIVSLNRKKDEFLEVIRQMDEGEKFFPVYFFVWVWDTDKRRLMNSYFKIRKIWELNNCEVQGEYFINMPLFFYSLPFGFIYDRKQKTILDREFYFPTRTIASIVPVQTEFVGTGEPQLIFLGRKGQLVTFDIFSKYASSYNFFIVAPTGKGKSFLANYILTCYYGAGAKIRVVDVGFSYKKLCKMFGGKYIEFAPDSDICINFFEQIKEPEVDLPVVTQVLAEMAKVNTGELPQKATPETALNILRAAVSNAYRLKGPEATIDDVYVYLSEFPKHFDDYDLLCREGKEECHTEFNLIATHLAFNLFKFTSYGDYGKYFNKKTTFTISDSDFVVLELEHLKRNPDLFPVITLGVFLLILNDLYLSDRSRPTLILLDEAWQFLQDTPAFQNIIEEGYRRARKYYGSFGVITQSVLDFESFGRVGSVINANSSTKFYLESTDFRKAKDKKLLPVDDDFIIRIMESAKYNAPKYSEVFIYTDYAGFGVVRHVVDKFSYYIYTTSPREVSLIESLVSEGMSYAQAIDYIISNGQRIEDMSEKAV